MTKHPTATIIDVGAVLDAEENARRLAPHPTEPVAPKVYKNVIAEALAVQAQLDKITKREDATIASALNRYATERNAVMDSASDAAKAILEAAGKAER